MLIVYEVGMAKMKFEISSGGGHVLALFLIDAIAFNTDYYINSFEFHLLSGTLVRLLKCLSRYRRICFRFGTKAFFRN